MSSNTGGQLQLKHIITKIDEINTGSILMPIIQTDERKEMQIKPKSASIEVNLRYYSYELFYLYLQ